MERKQVRLIAVFAGVMMLSCAPGYVFARGGDIFALGDIFAPSGVFAEKPRDAALAIMEDFLVAFNARDEQSWADTLHFPHVRLASGEVKVYATKTEFVAAMDLDAFAKSSGWDHSVWDTLDVVQESERKVHIVVTFSRYTASGDKMASYPSFYVLEKLDGRWGVRARSSFAP